MQKAGFSSINCSFKRKCLLRTANLLYSLMKSMKQRLLHVVGQHQGEAVGERWPQQAREGEHSPSSQKQLCCIALCNNIIITMIPPPRCSPLWFILFIWTGCMWLVCFKPALSLETDRWRRAFEEGTRNYAGRHFVQYPRSALCSSIYVTQHHFILCPSVLMSDVSFVWSSFCAYRI